MIVFYGRGCYDFKTARMYLGSPVWAKQRALIHDRRPERDEWAAKVLAPLREAVAA